jgi:broad specificity phosphatase PhoE
MGTLYLIRHAEPVPPWDWDGSDATRPLSKRGIKQAQWMGRHLATLGVTELRSAPHERCRQTAAAIGKALGLEPLIDETLHIARSFTVQNAEGVKVWVAHSNNIPGAILALGVPGYRCAHASAWQLEFDETGKLERFSYIEPEV